MNTQFVVRSHKESATYMFNMVRFCDSMQWYSILASFLHCYENQRKKCSLNASTGHVYQQPI